VTVSIRKVDEIHAVLVTDLTRASGIGALVSALSEVVQSGDGKVLLEMQPTDWDDYGFEMLDSALGRIEEHQGKVVVVCRLGELPIKDIRWTTLFAKAECFDTLEKAITALREDC
jgi:hypothetical protein